MRRAILLLSAGLTTLFAGVALAADNATPHNIILFVPDGLRGKIVTPDSAPAMAEVRDKGVNFKNSHSLFPTFTMANGSAMSPMKPVQLVVSAFQTGELSCSFLI